METFTLDLNFADQLLLKDIARERGYKNVRELINKEVENLPSKYKPRNSKCNSKKEKFKNIYPIPESKSDFYDSLACHHSTTVSTVIFRFVILPLMLEKLIINHTAVDLTKS